MYNRQISQPLPANHNPHIQTQQLMQSNQPLNQHHHQSKQEQIYAPVAHLQQKMINHQQQDQLKQIQPQQVSANFSN